MSRNKKQDQQVQDENTQQLSGAEESQAIQEPSATEGEVTEQASEAVSEGEAASEAINEPAGDDQN